VQGRTFCSGHERKRMIRLPYKMPLAIGVRPSACGMVDVPQSPAIIEPIRTCSLRTAASGKSL
jgi:hypothetical protein